MKIRLAAAALAAAANLYLFIPSAPAAPADPASGTPQPAANPAAPAADIAVRQVVLFSSGVGYFEHYGSVEGSGSTELRFKSAQINDILKSLVLQDLDKGRVTAVTYPSLDPVAKTLRSFQVDITANPSLAELLNQLRGAQVSVTVDAAGRDVRGTILGVEKKQRPAGGADKGQVIDAWYLNLIAGAEIRQVPLDDVRDVHLLDPRLQDELHRALAALAAARDQDKKPVTIHFAGQGRRRVRIGYVVETPVWKTSYRLILSGPAGAAGDAPAGGPAEKPGGPGGAAAPDKPKLPGEGKLQGWAIIENQTDNDWNDVELSLVSGRPISFIQDLYQPLYIPRPVVQPELYASLRPQTYDAGLSEQREELRRFDRAKDDSDGDPALQNGLRLPGPGGRAGRPGNGPARPRAEAKGAAAGEDRAYKEALDPSASVASVASAARVGELFQYTVGSVSLPRQTSAMIPIVSDALEVEKLSIYNAAVLPRNPLNGARVRNTTGKHLLAGPLTVLEGGSYAGDARIDNVPPGQERLISYGVDQQVMVDATKNKQEQTVLTGKVVKGVLTVSRRYLFSQDYVAENKGDKGKTLLIEHPRRGGEWNLLEPKPDETTDTLYRFKGRVEAGRATSLTVREALVSGEEIAILPADVSQLEAYVRTGPIPQPVKDALAKAVTLKNHLTDTDRQIQQRQQQTGQIGQEQARLRENMKTVAPNSDYYNRLLKKLDEQETSIERLQKEVQDLQKAREQQRKELEDYLGNLNVEG